MTSRLLLTLLHFSLYTIITILTTLPSIASAEKITFPKIDRRPKPDAFESYRPELTNASRKQSDNHLLQTRSETVSRAKTIMPGVGIGNFTLGMSKDEV